MIELRGIKKAFEGGRYVQRVIFMDASFELGESERSVAIMGRSGSGKTTLLRMLAGMDLRYEGEYLFMGERLSRDERRMARFRREHVGFVTQSYNLLDDRDVAANVALALNSGKKRACASAALERVGLGGYESRRVHELSGGEAQRVAVARAIVKSPDLILADEPTGALDEESEAGLLDLFDSLAEEGKHLIVATHNDYVASRCDSRRIIRDCHIVR